MGCITGCLSGIMKYLVFAFNLVFVLAGLALLVLGIVYKLDMDVSLPSSEGIDLSAAPVLLIVVGTITLVIAFLGCCGAWKENSCMLTSYAIILICLLIIQMAAGIFAFVMVQKGDDLIQEIDLLTEKLFEEYKRIPEPVDAIQQLFSCCGFNNKGMYNGKLPASCCEANEGNCDLSDAFEPACRTLLSDSIMTKLTTIGYVAIVLCSTELLAIIFSFCLSCSIRKERR